MDYELIKDFGVGRSLGKRKVYFDHIGLEEI